MLRLTRLLMLLACSWGFFAPASSSLADQPAVADASSPSAPLDPITLSVYPPGAQLSGARDRQSFVVQAVYRDGLTEDVTERASFSLSDPQIAVLQGDELKPQADGSTELVVEFGGMRTAVPVVVRESAVDHPVSFKIDVMPVFMRAGCNTGSCHGAARGKDGFMLSLFGYDPDGDHFRLTRQMPGRRINLAIPEESLLIQKAIGAVPHTGGKRFDLDSSYAETLLRWHRSGATNDTAEVPQVTRLEIFPGNAVLNGIGATQRLSVRAQYSDGTDRDVTSLAVFLSNNDNSASISDDGVVTGGNPGEAFIMARFATHTVGAHFIVLQKDLEFQWQQTPASNYVDEHIHAKLQKLRIQPSDVCSDAEFARRVTLDIAGMLPTVEEYEAFLADSDPRKRERLVDQLLQRKEFVELWVMKWAELLMIRTTQQITYKPMLRYHNWLQDKIANNVPIDQMVQELLGASGGTFENAATNYYQMETDPLKVSENVAQVFMGMRIQCAQCHNHPFDRWTMDDYYGFAAFFAQIGRKPGEDPRETIVFNSGGGEVSHPVDGRVMQPKFLGGETPDVVGKDRRVVMAHWLASKDNPYFARNLTNIVWSHFFGKGIIDEVDDVRVSNPAVNEELLEALSTQFTQSNYDLKQLVRDICTSRTYQRSLRTNESNERDSRNFSHASLRRIRAEILLDAISQVTDSKNKFSGLPLGARAVQISNGNTSNYFLTTFGRASRGSVCACEVKIEPNLSQALHLLNGDTIAGKISEGNLVGRRLAEGKTADQIVDELYVRCLSRRPTDKERATLQPKIAAAADTRVILEDTFWALLNSQEFLFNH